MESNSNSTLNTVLIILLVLVALILGGWGYRAYFAGEAVQQENNDPGLNIDVDIPTNGDNGGNTGSEGNTQ
ncbi:MAG TPA: hypothetical protein PLF31_01710 [Candidatus Paceibacterota bacterium]|nr:hypothetical protein [Candidatus Paceibacterota bacterium]